MLRRLRTWPEAGRLYQWKEKFWGRRYQGIIVSNEAESQIDRLEYILSHGVKEGLVERSQDWPGAHSVNALLTGLHEPESSHLDLLRAVAGEELLARSYRAALEQGYRWHEFGDSHLILP